DRARTAAGGAVGVAGNRRVVSPARRDEIEAGAAVRVLGQAAVLGRGADRDHVSRPRRVRDLVALVVAGGTDDGDPVGVGVVDRAYDLWNLGRRRHLVGQELEAQVDHLGSLLDRVADPARDRRLLPETA